MREIAELCSSGDTPIVSAGRAADVPRFLMKLRSLGGWQKAHLMVATFTSAMSATFFQPGSPVQAGNLPPSERETEPITQGDEVR